MAKRGITFELRLYANYSVEADSAFDAVEIGGRLVCCDSFLYNKPQYDLLCDEQVGDAINDLRVYIDPDNRDGTETEYININDYMKE